MVRIDIHANLRPRPLLGLILVSVASLFCALPTHSCAQQSLEYKERRYGFEGVKANPVSGFDLELLSARVDYDDNPTQYADDLQLKFYLDRPRSVSVVVRELDQKYYYWLDKVRPPIQGKAGFENGYSWPTGEVIRHLAGLKAYDLGVVVRIDKQEPSAIETVAPAVLYQSKLPEDIKGYLFAFRLRNDAKIRAAIYDDSKGTSVFNQDLGRQRGGRPFTIKWTFATASVAYGQYRLVLSGFTTGTNDSVSQVVKFFHAPM